MKPAPFGYRAPETLAKALDLLAGDGEQATVLTGGRSPLPLRGMRALRPRVRGVPDAERGEA